MQQAQNWAFEAKTQRGIVISILKALGLPEQDYNALPLALAHIESIKASAPSVDRSTLTDAQITAGADILCDCPNPKRIGRNSAIDVYHAMVPHQGAPSVDRNIDFHGFDIDKLPAILISCVAKLWPGTQGMFWEAFLELMPARIEEWKALAAPQQVDTVKAVPEDQRERLRNALSVTLGEAMDCARVWSAWGVGTMSEDDFSLLADNDERLDELVDAVLAALASPSPAVPTEPDAWMHESDGRCTSAASKKHMETCGFGVWHEAAAQYTKPLFFGQAAQGTAPNLPRFSDNWNFINGEWEPKPLSANSQPTDTTAGE